MTYVVAREASKPLDGSVIDNVKIVLLLLLLLLFITFFLCGW
jgi:hypothetical protein